MPPGDTSLWGDDAAARPGAADDALDPTVLFHRGRIALDERPNLQRQPRA